MADTKLSAIASEATPSVGDERLYLVQELAGAPASKYIKIGDICYHSATAPTTPEDGFLWLETDTGILWIYGTYASASRWVSANLYNFSIGANTAVVSANTAFVAQSAPISGYDHYIDDFFVQALVITTNSGSHYWKAELRKVSTSTVPAAGGGTGTLLGGGVNTSAQAADAWFELSESIDATIDRVSTGVEIPFIDFYKSGSPGNTWIIAGYTYRLIHP